MERIQKTWGERYKLFQNSTCEVNILYLRPQQRCSWHKHRTKYNQFFVIEGEIAIKTEWGVAIVAKEQIFTTKPGEWHEFQTRTKPAVVQEVMFVEYDAEDIERDELGGPMHLTPSELMQYCREGGHQ